MRLLLSLLVAAPLTFVVSGEVAAQPVTPQAACSYSDCAIRVEPGFFLGPEIVQGEPSGEVVLGRVGWLVGGLEEAVSASPTALEHTASARRARIGSLVAFTAGTALTTYALGRIDGASVNPDQYLVYFYSGLAVSVVGAVFELKSQREQSRAVWEYNRTLAGE